MSPSVIPFSFSPRKWSTITKSAFLKVDGVYPDRNTIRAQTYPLVADHLSLPFTAFCNPLDNSASKYPSFSKYF